MKYYYVTDSSSFRLCVGSADEDAFVQVRLNGDTMFVEKYSWRNARGRTADPIDSDLYYLSNLRASRPFDD